MLYHLVYFFNLFKIKNYEKKIVILGSTGSIGKTTFDIIKNNQNYFEIVLLTTNKNIKKILKQAKI